MSKFLKTFDVIFNDKIINFYVFITKKKLYTLITFL